MRRWIFIAALSAALVAIPVWGQRGGRGGMSMGGSRAGGYGGAGRGGYGGGGRGGAYGGGGFHGGYGYGRYGYSGHYPYYSGRYYPWGWGYRGGYGYGWYGYPWASWGWYGGVGWYGDSYSYPAAQYPVSVYPDNGNTVAYDQQIEIDRLNDEVARLLAERESGTAGGSAPRPPPKPEIRAATVLVFRNHHTEEIQDYAIVGKTLWVFTEQRARKIPIAELDVPATTKANAARGIDFLLPAQ